LKLSSTGSYAHIYDKFSDSLQTHPVAILVPDQTYLGKIGEQLGVEGSIEDLLNNN
jgi:hypothetical protein